MLPRARSTQWYVNAGGGPESFPGALTNSVAILKRSVVCLGMKMQLKLINGKVHGNGIVN